MDDGKISIIVKQTKSIPITENSIPIDKFFTQDPPNYVCPRFYRILGKKKTPIQARKPWISVVIVVKPLHARKTLHIALVKCGFHIPEVHQTQDLLQTSLD